MTEEDRRLLRENNLILKLILLILDKDDVTPNEFAANIIANLISNKISL